MVLNQLGVRERERDTHTHMTKEKEEREGGRGVIGMTS
jgi:hypothetical protein